MKKLLTKWWFWVIVIIVIIAIISGIKDSKKEAKINGNIVSFTLTDSTFNTYPEDNIVKEVNSTPDTIDSSKAYAKTRCKSGADVDTVKSEIKFIFNDDSIAQVNEITVKKDDSSKDAETSCTFTPLADGITKGHFENADGTIKSEDITITVSNMVVTTLKELEGTSLANAMSTVKENGYTASYKHEQSGYDFTEEVKAFDSDQIAKYVITKVNNIDAASKKVSFTINTQENIDENNKAKEMEETLSSKLSATYAWTAAAEYGKNEYPYGFKLHYIKGKLAEKAVDENTWFLKATCTVTNGYNASMEMECEAKVTGTNDNPEIIEFNVY